LCLQYLIIGELLQHLDDEKDDKKPNLKLIDKLNVWYWCTYCHL